MLWLLIGAVGVGLLVFAGMIDGAAAPPASEDAADQLVDAFRSAGANSTALLLNLGGGALTAAALVGFALTFGREVREADPVVVGGLGGAPLAPTAPPLPEGPPKDSWTEEIDYDPTAWDHPAGTVFVIDGASAGPTFDAVKGIAGVHNVGSGLLVAMLQGLTNRDRKLVVVLGTPEHVEAFETFWTASGNEPAPAPEVVALRAEIKAAGYMVLAASRV
ncbi:MAG: hypothetical protein GY898_33570 [Proteobacteria bacterium]|nr:hypothetical protein [Pseudomonadota bacterium]